MIKSIIKEVFIIVLLIVSIMIVLGIIFYDYNPTTKKVPSKVEAYTLSQDMQEELNETIEVSETQNIVKTYKVNSSDLKQQERNDDYKPGKINPFAPVESEGSNNANGNLSNSIDNNSNTTDNKNQSQGSFLNTIK